MLRSLLAMGLLLPGLMPAQAVKIEGDWTGALEAQGVKLRLVVHITAAAGGYSATMDSLDQGASGIPVSKVTLEGDALKMEVAAVQGSYSGTVKGDEITGQWTQGPGTLPLNLRRGQAAAAKPVPAQPMTAAEREFLVGHLERTLKLFEDAIAGLSPAQWTYKPAPDRWSVAECAEHVIATEGLLFGTIRDRIMKIPPVEGRGRHGREMDEKVLASSIDRTAKAQAAEPARPTGKYAAPADAARAMREARARTIEYVKTTQDDLRVHATPNPGMDHMDAYQFLLLLAGHTERHKLQMDEVKASAGYPKN